MRIVSDTSPLINLAAIGRIDLLEQVFGEILISDAVYREIIRGGGGKRGFLKADHE